MKKVIALCLGTLIMFLFAACGKPASSVTFSIPDDVTEANVSHVVSGQESKQVIGKNDLQLVKDWLSGLQCEQKRFEMLALKTISFLLGTKDF